MSGSACNRCNGLAKFSGRKLLLSCTERSAIGYFHWLAQHWPLAIVLYSTIPTPHYNHTTTSYHRAAGMAWLVQSSYLIDLTHATSNYNILLYWMLFSCLSGGLCPPCIYYLGDYENQCTYAKSYLLFLSYLQLQRLAHHLISNWWNQLQPRST